MKYFLDTEFIESGRLKPIQLISIGIVAENGQQMYAESSSYDPSDANEWVRANVLPKLLGGAKPIEEIAAQVVAFVGDDPAPEFWGYFADYDWVVFCQMFGTMMDLPKNFPMYCRDLKQLADERGVNVSAQFSDEHNALADALWNRSVWESLAENRMAA